MTRKETVARVLEIVSECGEVPAEQLRLDEPLHRYGIDSLAGVNIAYEVGLLMGRDVPEALLTEQDTIDKIVDYVLS